MILSKSIVSGFWRSVAFVFERGTGVDIWSCDSDCDSGCDCDCDCDCNCDCDDAGDGFRSSNDTFLGRSCCLRGFFVGLVFLYCSFRLMTLARILRNRLFGDSSDSTDSFGFVSLNGLSNDFNNLDLDLEPLARLELRVLVIVGFVVFFEGFVTASDLVLVLVLVLVLGSTAELG